MLEDQMKNFEVDMSSIETPSSDSETTPNELINEADKSSDPDANKKIDNKKENKNEEYKNINNIDNLTLESINKKEMNNSVNKINDDSNYL